MSMDLASRDRGYTDRTYLAEMPDDQYLNSTSRCLQRFAVHEFHLSSLSLPVSLRAPPWGTLRRTKQ